MDAHAKARSLARLVESLADPSMRVRYLRSSIEAMGPGEVADLLTVAVHGAEAALFAADRFGLNLRLTETAEAALAAVQGRGRALIDLDARPWWGRLLARPDLRFVDPFNDVVGVDRVVALLDHLFSGATGVAFTIRHQAWDDDTAFYRWDFGCRLKRPAMDLNLVGVSEVRFDREARVALHVDHWDAGAQIYERLPVLGAILRRVRRRLSAGV